MPIAQTFDGNGAPASKVETSRSDPNAPAAVTSTYYLRSTVLGGKVVAELDNTGYKRVGHIFAGGMEIATQTILNPGYGSQVSWTSTNPATGSEYIADSSRNVGRQERDPLGADVTSAPTNPLVVDDPVFYDSKFNHMPIAYEGGQTEDAQIPDWYLNMAYASWDEHLAQGYWQSGHYDIAAQVVANNPNVGVEYNIVGFGLEKPMTGSIFGAQAADFLNALGTMIENGTLVQVGGPGFSADNRRYDHVQKGQNNENVFANAESGIGTAQAALMKQRCRDLFANDDGLRALDSLMLSQRIVIGDFVNTQGWRLTEHPDTDAMYSPEDDKVYINPRGALANGDYSQPIFHRMTKAQVWALIYIHETAHKTNDFGPDSYGNRSKSLGYSMRVRVNCFPNTVPH